LSALVEDMSGALRLVTWQEIVMPQQAAKHEKVDELCVSPS
jgi:hypothetical protein